MLRYVKRSAPYRAVHTRLAGTKPFCPSDTWVEGEYAYLVFDLVPSTSSARLPPFVLFVVHLPHGDVVVARVIEPDENVTEARIIDLIPPLEGAIHGIRAVS